MLDFHAREGEIKDLYLCWMNNMWRDFKYEYLCIFKEKKAKYNNVIEF